MASNSNRTHWSGRLAFFLAAVGSAVGLGNIWKFPYITGENGGGAFVIVYLACIAAIGIPIFIAELYIGQKSQKNAVTAFTTLHRPGTPWQAAGWLGIVSAFLILSFYSVVGGWVLDWEFKSILNHFSGKSGDQVDAMLNELFASPIRLLFWHFIFMAMTVGIVIGGIKEGIERWVKILMPALFGILVFLFLWCTQLEGFGKAVEFLFAPDFSKLSGKAIVIALGHAFFTLSLGMAAMVTYGSYLDQDEDLVKTTLAISAADTFIALMAGVVIFSIVFSFGLEPSSGPGLMFVTLPSLFNQIPGGYVVSILFFILVAFAALTSAISLLEVVITYLVDERNIDRKKATLVVGGVIYLLGVLAALSFNVLADVKIAGMTFFDLFDGITANVFLPVGGLLIALFFGWVIGGKGVAAAIRADEGSPLALGLLWTVRVVTPICVLWVLLGLIRDWLKI